MLIFLLDKWDINTVAKQFCKGVEFKRSGNSLLHWINPDYVYRSLAVLNMPKPGI